jgi:Glycine rich protein
MATPAGAVPNPSCTGFPNVSCVFSATGNAISWPVPAGVTSLRVVADGASGANSSTSFSTGGGRGGAGGEYTAILSGIPSGTTLSVFPGSAANGISGGINANGGQGGNTVKDKNNNSGGGGGGASTVAVSPFSVSNLLVVAGGGGGGSAENEDSAHPGNGGIGGGSASTSGTNGGTGSGSTTNGRGGTISTPGTGGSGPGSGCTVAPAAGSQLNGGNAQLSTNCNFAGGGGGSGYFGGGGGGTGGGGGGGSAFPGSTTHVGGILVTPQSDSATNTGNGSVTISYTVVIRRTHLKLWSHVSLGKVTLYALLTGDGYPLANQPVSFGTLIARFCRNVDTSNQGIASCQLTRKQVLALIYSFGFWGATYAGGNGIPGTTATAVANVP